MLFVTYPKPCLYHSLKQPRKQRLWQVRVWQLAFIEVVWSCKWLTRYKASENPYSQNL